mgnify:CR=1 FL=1
MYLTGIPFYESYNIFVLLVNLAAAALSYYSFKKIFKSAKTGAAASMVYTLSIYRITDIYVRQAVGEYTALARALILIVLINMAFLVPFIDSYRMDLNVKNQEGMIQYMGARLFQIFGLFFTSVGHCASGVASDMPLCIGLSSLFCMVYFLIYIYRNKFPDERAVYKKAGCIMFALAAMTILFSTIYFPWDALESLLGAVGKQLVVIQYSWRYLGIYGLFIALLLGCLLMLQGRERQKEGMIIFTIIMVMTIAGLSLFYKDCANDSRVLDYCDTEPGGDEDTKVSDYVRESSYISFYCENRGGVVEFVNIPLWAYDNYRAYDMQTNERMLTYKTEGNRLSVGLVPGYSGYVMVKYVEPWYWKAAYVFSAAGVMLIIAIYIVDKKRKKAD